MASSDVSPAFDWPVNHIHSPDERYQLFVDASGFAVNISKSPRTSLEPVKTSKYAESFLNLSPPASPVTSSQPHVRQYQSALPKTPRMNLPAHGHARQNSAAGFGTSSPPSSGYARTPAASSHSSSHASRPAPLPTSTTAPVPSPPKQARPMTIRVRSPRVRVPALPSPGAHSPTHTRSRSAPEPPSPSIESLFPPDPARARMNSLNKLRRHLSGSVPPELVLNNFAKASARASAAEDALEPSPDSVEYKRLTKIRRHLSSSVPAHLVLSLPAQRCETVAEDEEFGPISDSDADGWATSDEEHSSEHSQLCFSGTVEEEDRCIVIGPHADEEEEDGERTPRALPDGFRASSRLGLPSIRAISPSIRTGSPSLRTDSPSLSLRTRTPSPLPSKPPPPVKKALLVVPNARGARRVSNASTASSASSFAPVRVEIGGRKQRADYDRVLHTLRSLR